MLVVCAGMDASAAEWLYEAASEIVECCLGGVRLGEHPGCELPEREGRWATVRWSASDEAYRTALTEGWALGLYCYRDLRDAFHGAGPGSGSEAPNQVADEPGLVEQALAVDGYWRAQPATLVQRYEEVVEAPAAAVVAIAAHLGVVLRDDQAAQIASRHPVATAGPGWRELGTEDRAAIAARAAPRLIERGDASDDNRAEAVLSVVVPSLNRALFLRQTLDSILSQDYPNIEVVVIDAGSTDGTLAILESYGDRVRWVSEPDRGPFDAINKGWAMTTGEVVAWLNVDDSYAPGAVRKAMAALAANPDADVVHGECITLAPDGKFKWSWGTRPWDYVGNVIACACTIEQPAAFMRREIVERVGGVHQIAVLDFDLWLRISAAGGRFVAIDAHLANAVDHPGRITNRPAVMVPAVVEAIRRAVRDPAAPAAIRANSHRAMSSAWAHGLYFARNGEWRWVARCIAGAVREDPDNTMHVLGAFVNVLRQPGVLPVGTKLPFKAAGVVWRRRAGIAEALQLAAMLAVAWRVTFGQGGQSRTGKRLKGKRSR